MKKNKYDISNRQICDYIFQDYIDNMDLDHVGRLIANLPMLVENNMAYCFHFQYEDLYNTPYRYLYACKFMHKYNDTVKHEHRTLSPYMFGGSDSVKADDNMDIVKLAKYALNSGKYFAKINENNYAILIIDDKQDKYGDFMDVSLYLVGDNWKKFRKRILKKLSSYEGMVSETKKDWIRYTDNKPSTSTIFKKFDQIIFKGKDDLVKYIDNWVKNIPLYYDKYHTIPRLSIMLYGDPGTGKSTVSRAVAKHLGMSNITSIDSGYFSDNSGNDRGRRSFGSGFTETVFVIDDIDCVCKSRELDDSSENSATLSNLLDFLDNPPTMSIKAENGVKYPASVVIASTNYFDKLDSAVTRYGRFDLKINMPNFTRDEAEKMCALYSLKLDDIVENANRKDFSISPAHLQAICLENVDKSLKGMSD